MNTWDAGDTTLGFRVCVFLRFRGDLRFGEGS